ncbi:unnamed protein product, partial [Effrenium voratum]
PGEDCYNEVQWAITDGINGHPDWYPGLTPYSGVESFQEMVHQTTPDKCPMPCGVLGAEKKMVGPTFSVDVLEAAKGSDGCLIEPQTEYEVEGWSELRKGVTDPRVCCRLCQQHGGCLAWVWTEWAEKSHDFGCFLKGGKVTSKAYKDGSVSGLPKTEAIHEAQRVMQTTRTFQLGATGGQ